jgi:hypothetical protein
MYFEVYDKPRGRIIIQVSEMMEVDHALFRRALGNF